MLAYSSLMPHWAYCGSARRYWDFVINGKLVWGNEREFHHYGSTLNAIPVLDHYRLGLGLGIGIGIGLGIGLEIWIGLGLGIWIGLGLGLGLGRAVRDAPPLRVVEGVAVRHARDRRREAAQRLPG